MGERGPAFAGSSSLQPGKQGARRWDRPFVVSVSAQHGGDDFGRFLCLFALDKTRNHLFVGRAFLPADSCQLGQQVLTRLGISLSDWGRQWGSALVSYRRAEGDLVLGSRDLLLK